MDQNNITPADGRFYDDGRQPSSNNEQSNMGASDPNASYTNQTAHPAADPIPTSSCGTSTTGYQSPQQPYGTPPMPKTWLAESILVTLFCCLPFGIVGIVNAAAVSGAYTAGRYEEALQKSQSAGKWTKIGFWCGLVVITLYFIAMFAMGFKGFFDN